MFPSCINWLFIINISDGFFFFIAMSREKCDQLWTSGTDWPRNFKSRPTCLVQLIKMPVTRHQRIHLVQGRSFLHTFSAALSPIWNIYVYVVVIFNADSGTVCSYSLICHCLLYFGASFFYQAPHPLLLSQSCILIERSFTSTQHYKWLFLFLSLLQISPVDLWDILANV